jgi:hypothetical protein
MEGHIGLLGWVRYFVLYLGVFVIPFRRIFKKAGFSPWLSILNAYSTSQCCDVLHSGVR